MRRKRLQHAAHVLCHMFCGWRLSNSYPDLEGLGSGRLAINALTAQCVFKGVVIPPLSIARELAAWLREDLGAHQINPAEILEASLIADLMLSQVERRQRRTRTHYFSSGGRHLAPAVFISLDISCTSMITTDEKSYTTTYSAHEEWPSGWPQA